MKTRFDIARENVLALQAEHKAMEEWKIKSIAAEKRERERIIQFRKDNPIKPTKREPFDEDFKFSSSLFGFPAWMMGG